MRLFPILLWLFKTYLDSRRIAGGGGATFFNCANENIF